MGCCTNRENVAKACENDRGTTPGLSSKFHLACADEVSSIPAKDAYPGEGMVPHTVTSDIVMVTDKVFNSYAWDPTIGQNSWKVEEQGEGQSKYHQTTVTGFIVGIDGQTANATSSLLSGEYIVLVPDAEGHIRIVGSKKLPATVYIGEQNDSKRGHPVTVSWRSGETPLFYTGTIPE